MSAGRPVQPHTNEYKWVANVIRSVEKLSGTPTRWNGELYEETRAKAAGSALNDGGMTVNVDEVLKPVALAYTAGRRLTEDELIDVRDAVLTVVHEARHLTHQLGDESAPGATPVYSPDTLALEEGLTETWTHQNADAVIHDIGMDAVQPGLLGTESFDNYPAYTAATDELIRGTAEVSGLSQAQVVEGLERADRTQRWSAVADLVIDQRMADVMPPEDREVVRGQLVQAMRPHLGDVAAAQESEIQSDVGKSIAGHQSAQRATIALSTTVADIENNYRDGHRQQGEVEHLRKFLGGEMPPNAGFRSRGDGAVPDNVRHLHGERGQGQGRE
ncbi:hypothetical protein GCM10009789_72770 [Kribbella sancticallisti]|uniref:ESX-1 secretion-associated protein EspA/EspE-like domain-containing protein n=1 Tax=Kribbella sancticallisti TaxID=460087 RepID=A0ABN2EHQ1_9ACTN